MDKNKAKRDEKKELGYYKNSKHASIKNTY
jgi:hypothetical protein